MATIYSPFSRDPAQRIRPKTHLKNVQKARRKHNPPPVPRSNIPQTFAETSLLGRFFVLPSEVRENIYRMLLIQPCQFDLRHQKPCRQLAKDYIYPWLSQRKPKSSFFCANCYPLRSKAFNDTPPYFFSPRVSRWELIYPNPFLCARCYEEKFMGSTYRPPIDRSKCICGRRENLQIMLVNRQFYRESSYIFWTENMFALESPQSLVGFLSTIRPETRALIRRLSFLAKPGHKDGSTIRDEETGPCLVDQCWPLLRACSGLRELEIDFVYISKLAWVLELQLVHPRWKVRFVDRSPYNRASSENIWLWVVARLPVSDPLADALSENMVHGKVLEKDEISCLFKQSRWAAPRTRP